MNRKWEVEISGSEYPSVFKDGNWVDPNDVEDALNSLEAKLKEAKEELEYINQIVRGNFNGDDLENLRAILPSALKAIEEAE